jgi:hypothetical protein
VSWWKTEEEEEEEEEEEGVEVRSRFRRVVELSWREDALTWLVLLFVIVGGAVGVELRE